MTTHDDHRTGQTRRSSLTVIDMIESALRAVGCDALAGPDGCACRVGAIAPGDCLTADCRAARVIECRADECSSCEWECWDDEWSPGAWRAVVYEPPEQAAEPTPELVAVRAAARTGSVVICDATEYDRMREALSRVVEWTQQFGAELCPPGPDTYGEGVRDAKGTVRRLLAAVTDIRACRRGAEPDLRAEAAWR